MKTLWSDAFTTPMIYPPSGGWEETLPRHLKEQVIWERLELTLAGKWDRATPSEVLCYLYPASLTAPFDRDWTDIYLWVTAQILPQLKQVVTVPENLSDWQKSQLEELRFKIHDRQIKHRKEVIMEPKLIVVLEVKDGQVMLNAKRHDTDPATPVLVTGGLTEALAAVPAFVTKAEEHWKDNPKNPKHVPLKAEPKAATTRAKKSTAGLPLLAGGETAGETAPAQSEAKTEVPTKELAEAKTEVQAQVQAEVKTEEPASASKPDAMSGKEAESRPSSPVGETGKGPYRLKDGRGPFNTIQDAMDALGLPKEGRPNHNRWNRLSKDLREAIIPSGGGAALK